MDPLSFTASLVTVAGLVAASSKKIYDLQERLKNLPKDVQDLLNQLQTFKNLLQELETQLQDHRYSAPPQETLQNVWGSSIAQMQRDVQSLQTVLSKVEPLLRKKSMSSKIMLLARQILSEKEVEQYQRKIDAHCGTLTSIQAIACGRKLDKLSQSIIQRGDEDRADFRTVSSQFSQSTGQLGAEVKAGLSTVSSQITGTESANEVRHQAVLAHLNNHIKNDTLNTGKMDAVCQQQIRSIDINEAGFQAVQSSLISALSASSEEHRTTHAMLSQCQGQIQQLLRNHITFETIEHSGSSPSTQTAALKSSTTETTVFWSHRFHRLPIGMLWIDLNQTRHTRNSRRSTPQVCTKSKIAVEFVPPQWLSSVVVRFSIKMNCDLISSQWRWGATLTPLTINHNSFFLHAFRSLDVEDVRRSFAEGLAKPTDYVLDYYGEPAPWYFYLLFTRSYRDSDQKFHKLSSIFHFMVENGLPGQDYVISQLSWVSRSPTSVRQDPLRDHFRKYLEHGGKMYSGLVDNSVLPQVLLHVDWVSDWVFRSSEPWLLDDLSSLDICLIGTVAHVDEGVRHLLKSHLASYRSPVLSNQEAFANNLFEATFGLASLESHFRTLDQREMYGLLSLLSRTGSTAMMKLFLDIGIDINEGYCGSLLGIAAGVGNMEIVCMLLEAGANSSLALPDFLESSHYLPDADFQCLLGLLVENTRPLFTPQAWDGIWLEESDDPLNAVIRSNRALLLQPKAPEILLSRNVFDEICLGRGAERIHYSASYMYGAISTKHHFVVELLLQKGVNANAQISQSFIVGESAWFRSCTWITVSVMCGAAACTKVLIQHGADITKLDGAGRSATQLAKANALASHPRPVGDNHDYDPWWPAHYATAGEDAETLAVVEQAFNLRFQGAKSLEDYTDFNDDFALQHPQRQDRPMLALQKTLKKALGIFLNPTQTKHLYHCLGRLFLDIRHFWSLSFYEALLIRVVYVLSYALLLALETHAFVKGRKRIPTPSRFLLSAVALLLLALVWGPSQLGFSWVSVAA